jgi:hypothetical protein
MEYRIGKKLESILHSFEIYRNDLSTFGKHKDISKESISQKLFLNIIKLKKELEKEKSDNKKISDFKKEHPNIITEIIERCNFIETLYQEKRTDQLISVLT